MYIYYNSVELTSWSVFPWMGFRRSAYICRSDIYQLWFTTWLFKVKQFRWIKLIGLAFRNRKMGTFDRSPKAKKTGRHIVTVGNSPIGESPTGRWFTAPVLPMRGLKQSGACRFLPGNVRNPSNRQPSKIPIHVTLGLSFVWWVRSTLDLSSTSKQFQRQRTFNESLGIPFPSSSTTCDILWKVMRKCSIIQVVCEGEKSNTHQLMKKFFFQSRILTPTGGLPPPQPLWFWQ